MEPPETTHFGYQRVATDEKARKVAGVFDSVAGKYDVMNEETRPTSDRVREAVFNVVGERVEGARVLDLFAGTGALGIEALSRGARFCLFVDDHLESRAIIRRNVEALHLTGVTKIWRRDATELGPIEPNAGGAFGLVFLDPPYRKGLAPRALESARAGGWLAPHALCIAETEADESFDAPAGFTLHDARVYGDTRVAFLIAD